MGPHNRNATSPPASLIAILTLVLFTTSAQAQRADLPTIKAGDRWQFVEYYNSVPSTKPNRAWVITAVSPTGIEGTDNGAPLRLTRDMNVLESSVTRYSNPKVLSFPLEFEMVKVPAGEFDAFRIAATEKVSGTSPIGSQYGGDITRTYWYAPAARVIVKTESRNPYLGPSTLELVAFELRP